MLINAIGSFVQLCMTKSNAVVKRPPSSTMSLSTDPIWFSFLSSDAWFHSFLVMHLSPSMSKVALRLLFAFTFFSSTLAKVTWTQFSNSFELYPSTGSGGCDRDASDGVMSLHPSTMHGRLRTRWRMICQIFHPSETLGHCFSCSLGLPGHRSISLIPMTAQTSSISLYYTLLNRLNN